MNSIFKIAVSGGAASGKSSVCKYFENKGIKVIGLDKLAHEVVLPGMGAFDKIAGYFGDRAVLDDGTLNRVFLRQLITENPEAKKKIEAIVQPEILELMHSLIRKYDAAGDTFVVVEVPLLFELGMEAMFDANILVCINSELQIERLMCRDGVTREDALALIDLQMPQDEKFKRAGYIVQNSSGVDDLFENTEKIFNKIVENLK